jgi:hypothetical protein
MLAAGSNRGSNRLLCCQMLLRVVARTGQSVRVHEPSQLADSYWDHYRRATSNVRTERLSERDVRWAHDEVDERVRNQPEEVIAVLVAIADAAPDDAALAYLGAGPIEDLIRHCGSVVVVDRIEGAASRSDAFRKALRCAWFEDDVPPDVAVRLRRFGDPC